MFAFFMIGVAVGMIGLFFLLSVMCDEEDDK